MADQRVADQRMADQGMADQRMERKDDTVGGTWDFPIRYAALAEETTVLGPGKRGVLWVQQCCFSCPECISPRYRSEEGGTTVTAAELAAYFLSNTEIEGVTISGGEPFLQARGLTNLLRCIKENQGARDLGVILYSGFYLAELMERAKSDPWVGELLKMADILIDGRYEAEKNDDLPGRGSSNQTIYYLTDRYQEAGAKYYGKENERQVSYQLVGSTLQMIGIPSHKERERWERMKGK